MSRVPQRASHAPQTAASDAPFSTQTNGNANRSCGELADATEASVDSPGSSKLKWSYCEVEELDTPRFSDGRGEDVLASNDVVLISEGDLDMSRARGGRKSMGDAL